MRWQHGLLPRGHGGGVPPLGLKNMGNTCYLNSVLQCLTYTPPLANSCLRFLHSSLCRKIKRPLKGKFEDSCRRRTDCPMCILEKRITRSLLSPEASSDAPSEMCSRLHLYACDFKLGYQEDAHEFLHHVINACNDACLLLLDKDDQNQLRDQRGRGVNRRIIVEQIFRGALLNEVKCLSCGFISTNLEEIFHLSLEISKSSSLSQAFQSFFRVELLDDINKYHCFGCNTLTPAKKFTSILQAPNVLVLQLKLFDWRNGGQKIQKHVGFEEVLTLSDFMSEEGKQELGGRIYRLYGLIVHSGSSSHSGHYYSYVKDPRGDWYHCNDSNISLSSSQDILLERPYILLYVLGD